MCDIIVSLLVAGVLYTGCADPADAQNITCTNQVRGTSTNACANTRFVEDAIANPATTLTVPNGGTGQTSFTANLPLIGAGASPIAQGTVTGNTTKFATSTGALTTGNCIKIDANGNFIDSGGQCGAGADTPHTQDFVSPGAFTPGSTTSLTLSSTPTSQDNLYITFDGIGQNKNTWSLAGAVVTFNAAIPLNTLVVEAKWFTSANIAGVNSLNGLAGVLSLVAGPGTTVTPSGSNITIGNDLSLISIQDAAYGAKCDTTILSSGSNLTIGSGSPNLAVTGASFVSGDVGKSIWVPGAGTAGAGLSTSILSVTNSTNIVLNNNAIVALSGSAVSQAAPLIYGTDDTLAINNAITAVPNFGTLFIPPTAGGCLIKQTGSSGVSLTVNHPINIVGTGALSRLVTDGSMGTTVGAIHATISGAGFITQSAWRGITWSGFTVGLDTNFVPFNRFGYYGIYFDATSGGASGFQGINLRNVNIGESGNYYSFVIDGIATQGNRFDNNFIWGGFYVNATADSQLIDNNRFSGQSIFGVRVDTPGAGQSMFTRNSMTASGGFCLLSGSWFILQNNYFEEVYTTHFPNGAFVDIGCSNGATVTGAQIQNNIIGNIVSATSLAIKIDAASDATSIEQNFIANNTNRVGVLNNGTTTVCGPNKWQTNAVHITGSGVLANNYGNC